MGFDDLFESDDTKMSDGLGKRLEILFTFIDSAVGRILDSLQKLDERITQVEERFTSGVGSAPYAPAGMPTQAPPSGLPPPPSPSGGTPPPPPSGGFPSGGTPPPPPSGGTPPPPPSGGFPSSGTPPPPPSGSGTLQSELQSAMQRRSSTPGAPPPSHGSGAPGAPAPGAPGAPGGGGAPPPSPMMLQAQLKDELRAAFAKIRSGLNEEDR